MLHLKNTNKFPIILHHKDNEVDLLTCGMLTNLLTSCHELIICQTQNVYCKYNIKRYQEKVIIIMYFRCAAVCIIIIASLVVPVVYSVEHYNTY